MNRASELHEFLAHFPGPAQPRTQPHFLRDAGGLSGASLWRFDSELGSLVARQWPAEFDDAARLERIHGWLRAEADLGVVPIPILDGEGRSVVRSGGRLWELNPWRPGEPEPLPSAHPERVRSAFHTLAEFHRRLERDASAGYGTSPGLRRRLSELEQLVRTDFDRFEAAARLDRRDELRTLAIRWLRLARPTMPETIERLRCSASIAVRLQPCIRDARRDHFLFEGVHLSGIVDFGAMDIESVVGDLARLIGDWLCGNQEGTLRRQALASYEEVRPLDPVERVLLPDFERSSLILAPGHWVRWSFVDRRVFEPPRAIEDGLAQSLARLESFLANRPGSSLLA